MPVFVYLAASPEGGPVEGRLDADSREAVAGELQRRGLVPIRIETGERAVRGSNSRRSKGKPIEKADLAGFLRNLATLTGAGLALDDALSSMVGRQPKSRRQGRRARELAEGLRDEVRKGATVADGLAASGFDFPPYVSSVVRAGEISGALPEVLDELAGFLERSIAAETQIRSALIYPILLLALSIGSIILFLTVILPQFAPLFADAPERVPAITHFFLGLSEGFQEHGWKAIVVLLILLVALRIAGSISFIAAMGDRLVLRMPIVGELVRQTETARLARTLGVLLRNGVKLLPALGIVQETISNVVMRKAMDGMRESLRAGNGLSRPMAEARVFPALADELVSVGERSGKLDAMLIKLADILDAAVAETTKRLLTLLVPLLTLGSAGIIALVVGSVFTALFGVYDFAL